MKVGDRVTTTGAISPKSNFYGIVGEIIDDKKHIQVKIDLDSYPVHALDSFKTGYCSFMRNELKLIYPCACGKDLT